VVSERMIGNSANLGQGFHTPALIFSPLFTQHRRRCFLRILNSLGLPRKNARTGQERIPYLPG
jgi:hypothetical protein